MYCDGSRRDPQLTPAAGQFFFFGGTFDPPHTGHQKIVRHLLQTAPGARVIVMPAASAPLRSDERLFSYRERFHLLRRAFAQEVAAGSVAISVLERRLPAPNYTVNTLTALAGFCAQKPIVVIGGDQAEKLPRWHRAEELFAQYEFLVFARGGATPNIPGLRARYVPDFAEDISATEMRALLAAVPAASRLKAAVAAVDPTGDQPAK
ncbi:MAG: nicotinate-nicotinamide nucleotide adenylyltransferase [Turneriella sp.]|nr:nicotinate-nicotinamide nucleotide adenylyltransferase [Turneriella sp.]